MSYQLRREQAVDVAGLQAMLEHSPGQAAQAILAAAGQGVVQAQLLLGQILLDGRGIEQDASVARRWFAIAAKGGSAMAHNMFGRCLEHGWGGEVDLTGAAIEYAKAADAELDWGMYNLGNLLATGRGVPPDQAQALACYTRAAHAGHARSMNMLGRYLEAGIACEADAQKARRWYRRSANAGDFRGQFSHATVLIEQGEMSEALTWLRQAAENGSVSFLQSSIQTLSSQNDPRLAPVIALYREQLQAIADSEPRMH